MPIQALSRVCGWQHSGSPIALTVQADSSLCLDSCPSPFFLDSSIQAWGKESFRYKNSLDTTALEIFLQMHWWEKGNLRLAVAVENVLETIQLIGGHEES